jgi:FAD/FMN-containing dehydrogenase
MSGNVHLNICLKEYSKEAAALAEPFVYEWTAQRGGSISAEHGLGAAKNNYIFYTQSRGAVEVMRKLKNLLDPNGILNPYKVYPTVNE